MKIVVLTLFPDIVKPFFENSIMARAVKAGLVSYSLVNWRVFAEDKHHKCDDSPFGGGAGMVIKPEPLFKAMESLGKSERRVIYATPSGKPFTQSYAKQLSLEKELVFVCGHYEGIDQRFIDYFVDDNISIGDYVVSSGETAVLVMIDAIYRLIDGVISPSSLEEESFTNSLLEYPQYTRPETYCGMSVPSVLLSGNHEKIRQWRLEKRLEKTLNNRPDLLEKSLLNSNAMDFLKTLNVQNSDLKSKSKGL